MEMNKPRRAANSLGALPDDYCRPRDGRGVGKGETTMGPAQSSTNQMSTSFNVLQERYRHLKFYPGPSGWPPNVMTYMFGARLYDSIRPRSDASGREEATKMEASFCF